MTYMSEFLWYSRKGKTLTSDQWFCEACVGREATAQGWGDVLGWEDCSALDCDGQQATDPCS
jgi:hypothetical protein